MAKVISIKSRKELGLQDFAKNRALVEKKGRYLGNLPSSEAAAVRHWQDALIIINDQINELLQDYHASYDQYLEYIKNIFHYLRISGTFNPALETLFINEDDGHIWSVKIDGKDL